MIKLNSDQNQAIDEMTKFISDPSKTMFMLEGSAGTGKTTCIQTLVRELDHLEFVLTAPTNKATKVLKEMGRSEGMSGIPCRTIYSLLGLRVQKDSDVVRVEALGNSDVNMFQVVVIDEASMLNDSLMRHIYEASINCSVKFIFMGDPMQLPPVGEDHSKAFSIPDRFHLTKVERHDNQILTLATSLRDCITNGETPKFKSDNDDEGGVYTVDHRRLVRHLEKAYTSEAYIIDPSSIKTIAWRNSQVAAYNDIIREAIYGDASKDLFVMDERIVATHPVPSIANPEEIALVTDEEGTITEINVGPHPMIDDINVYHLRVETEFDSLWADCFVVHPDSRRRYNEKLDELSAKAKKKEMPWSSFWSLKNEIFHDIRPCHSITAHRSQGSTYRTVFVDVEDILSNYNTTEALRCLYVAVTRASKTLVLKTR